MAFRNVQKTRARSIYDTFDRVLLRVCGSEITREHSGIQKFNRALHHLIVTDGEEKHYVFGRQATNKEVGPQPIEVLRAYVMGFAQSKGETIDWIEEEAETVRLADQAEQAEKAAKAEEKAKKDAEKQAEKEAAAKAAETQAEAPVEEKIAAKKGGKSKGKKKSAEKQAEPDFVPGEGEDALDFAAEGQE